MNQIILSGCRPEVMVDHLKALGIFRVMSVYEKPQIMARWNGDDFILETELSKHDVVEFFATKYRPTPVVSPWNKDSPFNKDLDLIRRLSDGSEPRFATYAETIKKISKIWPRIGQREITKDQKLPLFRNLINHLPDEALPWLYTAIAINSNERLTFGAILGTGGNDGHTEISKMFMNLVDSNVRKPDRTRINAALFGGSVVLDEGIVGFLDPGAYTSKATSLKGKEYSFRNPWDIILAVEGSMLFCGTTVRRGAGRYAAFPFTFKTSWVGNDTIVDGEQNDDRGEIWIPMWDRPATYEEIHHVFRDGMIYGDEKHPKNGLDAAIAISNMGAMLGIDRFQRFGIFKRKGKEHHMISIGVKRTEPGIEQRGFRLIKEADSWVEDIRRLRDQDPDKFPKTINVLVRNADDLILRYCMTPSPQLLVEILLVLGKLESHPHIHNTAVKPLRISADWVSECQETPEFRLALSLASIDHGKLYPIRSNLERVSTHVSTNNDLVTGSGIRWITDGKHVVWSHSNLFANMVAVLERRLIDVEMEASDSSESALYGYVAADLSDIEKFITGITDYKLISELILPLSCIEYRTRSVKKRRTGPYIMPEAYVCLKGNFPPIRPRDGQDSRSPLDIVGLLKAGRLLSAISIARNRLGISGYALKTYGRYQETGEVGLAYSERLAASMLFPIEYGDNTKFWSDMAMNGGMLSQ